MIRTYAYKDIKIGEIFAREEEKTNVADVVSEIIAEVRKGGDAALKRYAEQFDGAAPAVFEVSEEERAAAYAQADAAFLEVLKEAAAHIRAFHEKQKRTDFVLTEREGVVLGQKIIPLDRVGLYVPGGTASYPSTVLMDCIPAKIAGVKEVCMVTPAKDGKLNPDIIAAAEIAGVDRIFRIGGAQAVAALAYGTESIPRVDKIVGPGNAFVAEAKKQVFGQVSIDMIAGPSEILVIADGNSDAEIIAADLLSQAEHDKMASAVLVTESEALAQAVTAELERQIALLPRAEIARASIDNNGKIILVKDIAEAIAVSNEIAPEHLEVSVDEPFRYLADIRHAGSIFLGRNAPEALGDYFAGPNHTLPTSGTARFSSPLGVDDFVKRSSFTYYTKEALTAEAEKIGFFARREGLEAYTPGEQPQDQQYVKLNTNESPYPPSPAVVAAISAEEVSRLNLYPDPTGRVLKEKLAALYGVKAENIFLSNGSDDILNFAFMAFCDSERGAAFPEISYGFYPVYADLYHVDCVKIPLKEDFGVDYRDYCDIDRMVVIANPNAPTGMEISLAEIEEILKTNPNRIVLIDEAYIDFGGTSCVDLIRKYDNLLVVQTYSKSRSMAGARLGFAIADAGIIADLEKIKYSTNPYNINRLTLLAGEAAVESNAYYVENAKKIAATRDMTTQKLREMGFTVLDSKANFIFAKSNAVSGRVLYEELKKKGVLVRFWGKEKIEDFLRITIGTPEQMEVLFAKTAEILQEQKGD